MWFDGTGAMKVSDPNRLEALNSEIKRLEGLIEHEISNLARLRSIVGDHLVSEVLDEAKIQFAENRILGIRAEPDHALKSCRWPRLLRSMPITSSGRSFVLPGEPGECGAGSEERGVHEAAGGGG